jgi:ADP-heptose:LPS heptosyltransferase
MRDKRLFKWVDRYLGIPLLALLAAALRLRGDAARAHRPIRRGDRVLVAKLSALGDTLLLLPLLKALREAVGPEGRIELVVSEVNHDAVEGCPWVDGVLVPDLGRMLREPWYGWLFLKGLRSRAYTHALDLDQWLRATPLICVLGGAPRVYGFRTSGQWRHFCYTHRVRNQRGVHESAQFAAVAVLAGVDPARIEPAHGFLARHARAWKPRPGAKARALPGRGPLVVLHPGCGARGWQRAWPEDRYAALARRLAAAGARVALTGQGAYEAALCAKIEAQARQASPRPLALRNLAGRLDYRGLQALLSQARLLVSGNTGVMHLAALLGTPLVALHGPTDPEKWGPPSPRGRSADGPKGGNSSRDSAVILSAQLPCSPCLNLGFEYGCRGRACMDALPQDRVERACLTLLKGR